MEDSFYHNQVNDEDISRERTKTITLKDYFMKHFQSAPPKPAPKSQQLEIELKTFTKDSPFPKHNEEQKNNKETKKAICENDSGSFLTDFLDNLQELYTSLYQTRGKKQQFLNLLIYLDQILTSLSAKSSENKEIQIVDSLFQEDNFMIMVLSMGYEIKLWFENKIHLVIEREPTNDFLSIASNAIRFQFLENPQFMPPMGESYTVINHQRDNVSSDFLASRHEQRLNQMNQTYGAGRYSANPSNRIDYRQQPEQTPQESGRSFEDDQILYGLTVLDLTNAFRNDNGLANLEWNQKLCDVATEHSRDMAQGVVPYGHRGFERRCAKINFPRWSITENVALNASKTNPAEVAVQAWINSGPHRNNLLSNTDVCGVGCYRAQNGSWFFTQIFALSGSI